MCQIRRLCFMLLLAAMVFCAVGCGKTGAVVAKYNGGEITEREYQDYLEVLKAIYPGELSTAIYSGDKDALEFVLKYQVMSKYFSPQVKLTDEIKSNADESFNTFKTNAQQQLGEEKKLSEYYTENNVKEQEIKAFFLDQAKLEAYFSKDITEEDKRKEFESLKSAGALTRADYRHILISTEKRSSSNAKSIANDLVKQLRDGADFAKLATAYTDDPGSKESGGLYTSDQLPLTSLDPKFLQAVLTLPINQISDPVETSYGYHIIRVEKRTEDTYEDAERSIALYLAESKQQEFLEQELENIILEENIPETMIKPQESAPESGGQSQPPATD